MKNAIACGLVLALMVCVVPAAALSPTAFDDYLTPPIGGCYSAELSPYFGNLLENDWIFDIPVTIEIIQGPRNGSVHIFQTGVDDYWRAGDVIYNMHEIDFPFDTVPIIHDSFQYRLYDPQTGEYSNTATVVIDPVRYVNIPDRTVLHTPEDTEVFFTGFKDGGCFSEPGWDIDITDGPDHGNVAFGFDSDEEPSGYPFRYIPDAGFTGWDHLTYICRTETAEYGDCFSQPSELWISVGSEPYPSPEFPSVLLPVILLAGFLGSVLLIHRTREK